MQDEAAPTFRRRRAAPRVVAGTSAALLLGPLLLASSPVSGGDVPYEHTRGLEQAARAYEYAAASAPCTFDWTLLAGIADVASDHGRVGGDQRLQPGGEVSPPVFGLPLDGVDGRALIADTDQGLLDGDVVLDRAVGPFQFIPTTWSRYGVDGNGDGTIDPHNLWDAATSAAGLLCDRGIDTDPGAALEAYFGTDEWTPAVLESAADLWELEWTGRLGGSAFGALAQDVVAVGAGLPVPASSGPSIDAPMIDAPMIGDPSISDPSISDPMIDAPSIGVAGAVDDAPGRADDPSGPIVGDWNGDGLLDSGELETATVGDAGPTPLRLLLRDHEGLPYGRPIDVTRSLITAGLRPGGGQVVVGDWDGDGIDNLGVVIVQDGVATLVTFGRNGLLDELRPIGLAEPDATYVVVDRPMAALTMAPGAVSGELWETVRVADGTTLTLHRVGNIVVDRSISGAVEALLAHAAMDGIVLDGWGWRSHEQQISLRAQNCADIWSTPASSCSPPTAAPGSSRHEFGLAIDFHANGQSIGAASPEFAWLTANAATYGFFNLPSEPWHWSTDGG